MIRNFFRRSAQPADTDNSTGSILAAAIAGIGIAACIVTWAVQQPAGGVHARPVDAWAPATLAETARRLILDEQPHRPQRVIEPRRNTATPQAATKNVSADTVAELTARATQPAETNANPTSRALAALGRNLRGSDAYHYQFALHALRDPQALVRNSK